MAAQDFTFAVSMDFFTAFSKLSKELQKKVHALMEKFRENPFRSGLNLEKLNFIDEKLYSLRVNDGYRCIVLKWDTVYAMLWVASHDEAYAWAKRKTVSMDRSGIIHVLDADKAESHDKNVHQTAEPEEVRSAGGGSGMEREEAAKDQNDGQAPCPWSDWPDERLKALGIPDSLMAKARSMNRQDIDAYKDVLPEVCWEALKFLLAGESWEEVRQFLEDSSAGEKMQTVGGGIDAARAFDNPLARSHFLVNPDEKELADALEKPLEKWRIFLHPAQRKLVERDWNGPVRVLGGAGTGKTVVAMHRARWLAAHCTGDQKILFTTFSSNLAEDIRQNLSSLCSNDEMARIEVVNLDKWVFSYLKRENFNYRVCFEDAFYDILQQAVPMESSFSMQFLREEWRDVIQPQEVENFAGYAAASRAGRGRAISRAERKKIWPVFEEVRALMQEQRLLEPDDAMRLARERIAANGRHLYKAVVVDEAQDLSVQAFRLIRALAPEGKNDLFIVGDAHQRIFRRAVSLKSCGIAITGRAKKLRINYRTTEEIHNKALEYLKDVEVDDLDGGVDGSEGSISFMNGEEPVVRFFASLEEELDFMANEIKRLKKSGVPEREICVATINNKNKEICNDFFENSGIDTFPLEKATPDDENHEGIRIATMHRIKGLEFSVVFMTGNGDMGKEDLDKEKIIRNKSLMYVAATRAKQVLYIFNIKNIY